jgi:hypothetical protein
MRDLECYDFVRVCEAASLVRLCVQCGLGSLRDWARGRIVPESNAFAIINHEGR